MTPNPYTAPAIRESAMKEYKWIQFSEVPARDGLKTKIWMVYEKARGAIIGEVRWFGSWRKYAFYPWRNTVFEQDCLWDIADFIAQRTADHKEAWKAKRGAAKVGAA